MYVVPVCRPDATTISVSDHDHARRTTATIASSPLSTLSLSVLFPLCESEIRVAFRVCT